MIGEKLKSLIAAGAPIIVISSWEEEVIESQVHAAVAALGKNLYIWSAARGFYGDDNSTKAISTPDEAVKVLERLDEKAVVLFFDFHPYFSDPLLVRRIKENAMRAGSTRPQAIFSMPEAKIPSELERESTYLVAPLPDSAALRSIFEKSVQSLAGNIEKPPAPEIFERVAVAAAGLTRRQAERVYKMSLLNSKAEGDIIKNVIREKREITREALALEFRETRETFEEVGGLKLLKKWLVERENAFSEKARDFGLPSPRGLLLLGIQGCGKSLTAKAVADLWKLPLLRLDLSRIDPVAGEDMLIQALRTSEAVSPAVLWVDEIEKGFGKAGEAMGGVSLRALSAFITWLQEKTAPVYVVATANSISRMPPELLRKGRFDEIFFINLPDQEERRQIFRIHFEKRKRSPDTFDLKLLSTRSNGFSGAEIEACVVAGLFEAFAQGRDVNTADVLNAIESTIPLSTTMENEIKAIKDWAKGRARPSSYDARLSDLLKPM